MIKCTNCEEIFETENDLSTIVEKQELIDGEWRSTDRFILQGPIPEDTETTRYEVFEGCPNCMGDEYLTDYYEPNEADWIVGSNEYRYNANGDLVLNHEAVFNFNIDEIINVGFLDGFGDIAKIEKFTIIKKDYKHLVCKSIK